MGGVPVFVILIAVALSMYSLPLALERKVNERAADHAHHTSWPHTTQGLDVGEVDLIVQYDAGGSSTWLLRVTCDV